MIAAETAISATSAGLGSDIAGAGQVRHDVFTRADRGVESASA